MEEWGRGPAVSLSLSLSFFFLSLSLCLSSLCVLLLFLSCHLVKEICISGILYYDNFFLLEKNERISSGKQTRCKGNVTSGCLTDRCWQAAKICTHTHVHTHARMHDVGSTSALVLHLCHKIDNIIAPGERQTFTIAPGQEPPFQRFTGNTKAGRKIRRMAIESPYGNWLSRKEKFLSDTSYVWMKERESKHGTWRLKGGGCGCLSLRLCLYVKQ